MLAWLAGVIPFGMVAGMTVRTSGISTGVGLATGATIYSGSAQLTAIELLEGGAGIAVVDHAAPRSHVSRACRSGTTHDPPSPRRDGPR
jgi:hypothetical protein